MSVPSTRAGSAREGLSDLLVAYLRGDADARENFPIAAHEVLTRLARYHARFLPEDIREEVVGEAHLLLLQRPAGSFNPNRAEARVYLRLVIRDAVKRVAASYCPPGSLTRFVTARNDAGEVESVGRSEVVAFDDATIGNRVVIADIATACEHRCDVESVLRLAPSGVGSMMRRIYLNDAVAGVVAAEHSVSRFTMDRMITKFCASVAA